MLCKSDKPSIIIIIISVTPVRVLGPSELSPLHLPIPRNIMDLDLDLDLDQTHSLTH